MGYGKFALDYLIGLHNQGSFTGFDSVIELGAQGISLDALDAVKDHWSSFDPDRMKAFVSGSQIGPEQIYYLLGFDQYKSIDTNFAYVYKYYLTNNYSWDLNYPIPLEHKGKYDLITDFGTSEHVFNVYQVYKNIHDLGHEGSLILFCPPFQGYINHGFYNFQPCFFRDLASANNYSILDIFGLTTNDQVIRLEEIGDSEECEAVSHVSTVLLGLMRKNSNHEFVMPFQGYYRGGANALKDIENWLEQLSNIIKDQIAGKNLAISGIQAQDVVSLLRLYDIKVESIIDYDPSKLGEVIEGIEVKGLDVLDHNSVLILPEIIEPEWRSHLDSKLVGIKKLFMKDDFFRVARTYHK
ncbi:MAG: hypothetical protein ACM3UZ_14640 [Acidobacteriota bacterium]